MQTEDIPNPSPLQADLLSEPSATAAAAPPSVPPAQPPQNGEHRHELGDLEKMVVWVRKMIREGYQTDGKLNLAAILAAREHELDKYREKYRKVAVLSDWDGYGLPDRAAVVDQVLQAAGVRAEDLDGAEKEDGRGPSVFRVYELTALRNTIVLARPAKAVAIAHFEKRARSMQAAALAQLPRDKLTEDQRKLLYPVDATDDGDNEILASIVHPDGATAESLLERFPLLSDPLREQMAILAYANPDCVVEVPRSRQRAAIESALKAEDIAKYGGWKGLFALEAREIGTVIIRRLGRIEAKKFERAKEEKGGSAACFDLGERLTLHPHDIAALALDYPCLPLCIGIRAQQVAAGDVEIELKK